MKQTDNQTFSREDYAKIKGWDITKWQGAMEKAYQTYVKYHLRKDRPYE